MLDTVLPKTKLIFNSKTSNQLFDQQVVSYFQNYDFIVFITYFTVETLNSPKCFEPILANSTKDTQYGMAHILGQYFNKKQTFFGIIFSIRSKYVFINRCFFSNPCVRKLSRKHASLNASLPDFQHCISDIYTQCAGSGILIQL